MLFSAMRIKGEIAMPVALAFLVVILALPSAALAQSGAQITISL